MDRHSNLLWGIQGPSPRLTQRRSLRGASDSPMSRSSRCLRRRRESPRALGLELLTGWSTSPRAAGVSPPCRPPSCRTRWVPAPCVGPALLTSPRPSPLTACSAHRAPASAVQVTLQRCQVSESSALQEQGPGTVLILPRTGCVTWSELLNVAELSFLTQETRMAVPSSSLHEDRMRSGELEPRHAGLTQEALVTGDLLFLM